MRIVIDLEACQSPHSRHRGIGRYSMALAREMVRQGRGHEFILALNGTYEGTAAPIREAFRELLPQGNIVTWHATMPPRSTGTPAERRACEMVRESFFASLDADVVHVASLFEYGQHSFTTIGTGPGRHRTALTLYDLIPHVNREVYLRGEQATREYDEKLENLKRADLWLAISEASRREGIEHLGLPGEKVVNISSAADAHFTAGTTPVRTEVVLRAHYGLFRPFVMYTGGIDPRKNIPRLVEAWSRLPHDTRHSHQLALVCSVQPDERAWLEGLAQAAGLGPGELVVTGFVPEDHLVELYRMCKLFVFPSFHEGFGLPALEAMRCGAPVIGADNSSIPEVIGRADALFDAKSSDAIAGKIASVLADPKFRAELVRHGRRQADRFTWTHSARVALDAIERLGEAPRQRATPKASRPRLAYVAPLPPQRSGIADYSAELLPALARHYDIDAIVDQAEVDAAVRASVSNVRDAKWFAANARDYDRVLYHFGNSNFHEYMIPLLREHPGTVVLHDFFLSGMHANREFVTEHQPHWTRELYESHGWGALAARLRAHDMTGVIHEFPANFEVLREARGIIVHSEYSRELALAWYGAGISKDWRTVPHLRVARERRRAEARAALGLGPDDFLVCSFGIMGPTKLNARLMQAWKRSALAGDPKCHLVFVGQNDGGDYGRELLREMESTAGRVRITGWASPEMFQQHLDAADLAVQLRALSRGETSGTVLDAMCHGVPVIANANGTMAHLPREAVVLLDEEFRDEELVGALELLRSDLRLREEMGRAGRRIIETVHDPARCAAMYEDAIESFAESAAGRAEDVGARVGAALGADAAGDFVGAVAQAVAHNLPAPAPARRWLVDVTQWKITPADLPPHLLALFLSRAAGWRAEPVWLADDGHWRHARSLLLPLVGGWQGLLDDDVVALPAGDVWGTTGEQAAAPLQALEAGLRVLPVPREWHPDTVWAYVASHSDAREVPRLFVDISELVRHDWQSGIQRVVKHWLLELLREPPAGFTVVPVYTAPEIADYRVAARYLRESAGVSLPSGSKDEDALVLPRRGDVFFALDLQPHFIAAREELLSRWRAEGVKVVFMVYDLLPIALPQCFFPGAARHHERWLEVVSRSDMAICISDAVARELGAWLRGRGMAEPAIRHAHLGGDIESRNATSGLPAGSTVLLARMRAAPAFLMVGTLEPRKAHAAVLAAFEQLWAEGADCMLVIAGRPGWMVDELTARLHAHPEAGRRLHWISDASDEYLEALYGAATAMILASRGEGFGLPLVEAAQRGLPLIARDLPVFREVAGTHAHYFAGDDALPAAIREWLALKGRGVHPRPEGMPWLTWTQSAARLRALLREAALP